MRKLIPCVFACFPFVGISQVKFGVRAGINLSSMELKNFNVETKRIPRLNIGTILEIPIENNWFLYTSPFYSGKGVKYGRRSTTNTIDSTTIFLNYVELPFMLAYKFSEEDLNHFILSAGLFISYGFNGKESVIGSTMPIKHLHRKKTDRFKRWEFGFDVSSMYEINNKWGVRFDYSRSLFNIYRNSKRKNNVFGFSIFWYFPKKSKAEE